MDTHHVIRSVCNYFGTFWNLCVPRDVDLSSSLPSLAALQFRMLLKSGRELEQRLKYCVIEIVKSKPIHTERYSNSSI